MDPLSFEIIETLLVGDFNPSPFKFEEKKKKWNLSKSENTNGCEKS